MSLLIAGWERYRKTHLLGLALAVILWTVWTVISGDFSLIALIFAIPLLFLGGYIYHVFRAWQTHSY